MQLPHDNAMNRRGHKYGQNTSPHYEQKEYLHPCMPLDSTHIHSVVAMFQSGHVRNIGLFRLPGATRSYGVMMAFVNPSQNAPDKANHAWLGVNLDGTVITASLYMYGWVSRPRPK